MSQLEEFGCPPCEQQIPGTESSGLLSATVLSAESRQYPESGMAAPSQLPGWFATAETFAHWSAAVQ
jgi:hypothetical protein